MYHSIALEKIASSGSAMLLAAVEKDHSLISRAKKMASASVMRRLKQDGAGDMVNAGKRLTDIMDTRNSINRLSANILNGTIK